MVLNLVLIITCFISHIIQTGQWHVERCYSKWMSNWWTGLCMFLLFFYTFIHRLINSFGELVTLHVTTRCICVQYLDYKLINSWINGSNKMSGRHTDNWSHSGHYLVNPYMWPWSPNGHVHGHESPTATPFVRCQSALPFWNTVISKFDHENPWSRSCVWSKVKVTFDLQKSKVKVMVKVKPISPIWGLEFNRYVCFSFCGNRTTFGWDLRNSIFDLENSGSRSWPRPNMMVTFEALEFDRYVCFSFHGNRTIFAWDIAYSIFDLENARSRSWPRSNPMVTFEP